MAYNNNLQYASALLLISLILFAYPQAQAQVIIPGPPLIPIPTVNNINVVGSLCCTLSGTCTPGAAPIPGISVAVDCRNPPGTIFTVGTAITGQNGGFSITIPLPTQILLPIMNISCAVVVPLPVNTPTCLPLNSTVGVLMGMLQFVRVTLSPVFCGSTAMFNVSAFVRAG